MVSVKEDVYSLATNTATCVQNCASQINKVYRKSRSRLATETLFFFDCHHTAYVIKQLTQEVGLAKSPPPVFTDTNSRLVHDSEKTTTEAAKCRLCIEVSVIRELQDDGEMSIFW